LAPPRTQGPGSLRRGLAAWRRRLRRILSFSPPWAGSLAPPRAPDTLISAAVGWQLVAATCAGSPYPPRRGLEDRAPPRPRSPSRAKDNSARRRAADLAALRALAHCPNPRTASRLTRSSPQPRAEPFSASGAARLLRRAPSHFHSLYKVWHGAGCQIRRQAEHGATHSSATT
jgi:hypothetical protein